MCAPKAPTPPDPAVTSALQTGANVSTAIANSALGKTNSVGPDGSVTYSQSGTTSYNDPVTGRAFDIPNWTATTALSPAAQALKDQQDKAQLSLATTGANQAGRVDSLLSQPMDMSTIPAAADRSNTTTPTYGASPGAPTYTDMSGDAGLKQSYNTDFSADRQRVEDALMARLQPSLDAAKANSDRDLANRGVKMGSDAFDRQQGIVGQNENDARMAAILNAGQEQSRLAGLTSDEANFENQAKQQTFANQQGITTGNNAIASQKFADANTVTGRNDAITDKTYAMRQALLDAQDQARATALNESYAARDQPINEISALLSGSQISKPTFGSGAGSGSGGIPTTDIAGITQAGYGNQMNAYGQQVSTQNANTGAAAGITSAAIMAMMLSDKRVKKDIVPVGEAPGRGGKHKLYAFRYKSETDDAPKHVGVMAQEVEKKAPEAVMKDHRGVRHVNYGMLFAGAEAA